MGLRLGPAPIRDLAAPAHRVSTYRACIASALAVGVVTFALSAGAQPNVRPVATSAPAEESNLLPVGSFIEEVRSSCGDTPAARQLASAVHVELSAGVFTPPDPASSRILRCDVDAGTLTLWLSNREWVLDVSDIPRAARPRTLAVALAETLRMPPSELPPPTAPAATGAERLTSAPVDQNQTPPPPPAAAAESTRPNAASSSAVAPAVAAPLRRPAEWQLPMTLRGVVMGSQQTLAFGATLGASTRVAQRFRVSAHLGYLTARNSSVLGEARLHAANLEGGLDVTVLRRSANTAIDVGVGASLYRAVVTVDSVWGFDEPNVAAWFALCDLHAELSTAISERLRLLTHLRAAKDIVGLRLRAGGQEAMSFHGFGAELRLGVAYTW